MKKLKVSGKFDPLADFVLYEGDCLDLLKSVPDCTFQLIVTSPPYNIGKSYEKKTSLESYLFQQEVVIKECVRTLNDSGSICWQVGNFVRAAEIIPLDLVLFPVFSKLGLKLRNRIVWHFGHGLHASKRFSGRYEVILWFTKSDKYIFNLDAVRVPQKYPTKKYFKGPKKGNLSGNPLGKNPSDVWDIPNVKANHVEKTIHPCQFPIELVERLVLSLTNSGNWVFDPYMGVGSSAVASLIHGRMAAGAEVVKEYVEIALDRVRLAEKGELMVRPMERGVYDPNEGNSLPPKRVKIEEEQFNLFERGKYKRLRGKKGEKGL